MALTIYINNGAVDDEYGVSGTTWVEVDPDNDYFIFSAGSDAVADGVAIPTSDALNRAATLLTGAEQTVAKYFLADYSAGVLKEIPLAGSEDARYVFAFSFDAATASEPVLEVWDNDSLATTAEEVLGEGTPANSWFKAICTTSASSGASWTGTSLAGSTSNYFLYLNDGNGALSVADVLYMQFKVVIPASASFSGSSSPVMVVKYTSN